MIEYIVVDDETNPRELLIYTINSLGLPFKLIGEGKNLLEGIELIKSLKPQVVFLDIQMPFHSGLKIKDYLTEEEANFELIFVTAFDQFTIQAIRLSAFDYLLKPIEPLELKDCLNRILDKKEQSNNVFQQLNNIENNNVIIIKSHSGTQFIEIDHIISISAFGMYSQFTIVNDKITSSKPLKMYEQIHKKLFRCHRSYIVNLDYIQKIEGQNLILTSEQKIPLSRQKKKQLIEMLKSL